MIEYYEQLSEEEQDDIKHVIQTLYRQTFLLERKFEKRTGRMVPVREMCIRDSPTFDRSCTARYSYPIFVILLKTIP